MIVTVDRIEAGIAVCFDSDGNKLELPTSEIPFPVSEGMSVAYENDGDKNVSVTFVGDGEEERTEARARLDALLRRTENKNK